MDISMDSKSLNSYQKVYSGENICKLTADAVIPDTYEDISRLLGTEFSCKIISKDALFGKVTVCGELEANSLFVSEKEDFPSSVSTVMPFSAEFSSDDIDSSSVAIASLKIIASDWRELNPRKIGINADVLISLEVYNKSELSFPAKSDDDGGKVFYKQENIELNYISAVSEKLSTLDDEREVAGAQQIISNSTEFYSDSYELVGSRLIVKGHTHSRVLISLQDGTFSAVEYDIAFSQLFDSTENADISDCVIQILSAGEYYEIIDGMLNTEIRIVSQLVCYERVEESCVTDAYACGCEYELRNDSVQIIASRECSQVNKHVILPYDLPSDACSVMISSVRHGRINSAGTNIKVPLIVNAMYADNDGNLYAFRVRENVEFEDISCECIDVIINSASCTKISGKAQFELQISIKCTTTESKNLNLASAIKLNDEQKLSNTASLYIVRVQSNDLWSICKKYGADLNRIIDLNSLNDGDGIEGKMLLIPM